MAITSSGYDGSVDEQGMAGMVPKTGTSEYGVSGAGDFAVSAVAGQDRTVSIASGTGWGHFILDVSSANETRALAAPASGSRWDMICLHRDWQPVGGATTVKVIQSGSTSTTLPTRDNDPGVTDDQPLALVRVDAGSTTIGDIIDLRCWGRNGGVYAKSDRVLQYLTAIGTDVTLGRISYTRVVSASNVAEWQRTDSKYAYKTGAKAITFGKGDEAVEVYIPFNAGIFSSAYSSRPNIQLTVTAKSAWGRFTAQADDVSVDGFMLRVYQTDLSEQLAEPVQITVDYLATQ